LNIESKTGKRRRLSQTSKPQSETNGSPPNADSREPDNSTWTVQDAKQHYGVDRWGMDYFGISESGNLTVKAPTNQGVRTIEFSEILDGLKQRGLDMPVMLRLENLVDDRITKLNETFAKAIAETNYNGEYRGVFPIKVNQQNHVIAEIARFGKRFNHGLEAGSKAELLIAISSLSPDDSLIVCNGYKDAEFIDLGLHARRMGFQIFFAACESNFQPKSKGIGVTIAATEACLDFPHFN